MLGKMMGRWGLQRSFHNRTSTMTQISMSWTMSSCRRPCRRVWWSRIDLNKPCAPQDAAWCAQLDAVAAKSVFTPTVKNTRRTAADISPRVMMTPGQHTYTKGQALEPAPRPILMALCRPQRPTQDLMHPQTLPAPLMLHILMHPLDLMHPQTGRHKAPVQPPRRPRRSVAKQPTTKKPQPQGGA